MRELTLLTTWKCNASCDHCFANCGPNRTEVLPLALALDCIDAFAEFCPGGTVSMSGGEAFLFPEALEAEVARASARGCYSVAVTNGFWAATPAAARESLCRLQLAGLDQLQLSADDFHAAFVPVEYYKNIIAACAALSMALVIKIAYAPGAKLRKARFFDVLGEDFRPLCPPERVAIQEFPLVPTGRGAALHGAPQSAEALEVPCGAVGFSGAVAPDGSFYACCGCGGVSDCGERTPVYVGNIDAGGLLPQLRSLEGRLLIQLLRTIGPLKVLRLARALDPAVQIAPTYWSLCHICADLFRPENRNGVAALLAALQMK